MTIALAQSIVSFNHTYSGTLGSNGTIGNTLLLGVIGDNNSSATSSAPLYNGSSVTGAQKVFERTGTGNGLMYAALWMLPALPSAGTSVSVTCTASSVNGSLTLAEWSGLGPSPTVQGTPVTGDGVATASLGPTSALASAPALVVMIGAAFFGWTTEDGGWTNFLTTSNNQCLGYQLPVSAGSTYSWAGTVNSGDGWSGGIALITPAAPPAGTVPALAVTRTEVMGRTTGRIIRR